MAVHKCMLLAPREIIYEDSRETTYAWEYAQGIFEELQKNNNGFELNPIDIKVFANGERRPQIEYNVRKRNAFVVFDPNAYPSDCIVDILLINQALAKSQTQEIIDVFPFMPYLRQDRKDRPRVPISARALARVIQLDGDRVITIDAHNRAIDGMYDIPFENLIPYPTFARYLKSNQEELEILDGLENLILASPDKGGAERVDECAEKLDVYETIIGDKKRKRAGEIDRLRITEKVEGKNVMIIDDMIDKGGTGQRAKEEFKELGAKKVFIFVTAGLFTKGLEYALQGFDRAYVADTRRLPKGQEIPKNLRIVPYKPLFAEAIYRTSEGRGISELFK
jgi:ribose-phosphate pyrophosphokinase